MTLHDSFWSPLRSLAPGWYSKPVPARRTAVYTTQHIETLSAGTGPTCPASDYGTPHLPTELIVEIVLLAASDSALTTSALLNLARVNRACHRAIVCDRILPIVCLSTPKQLVAFAIALDKNRLYLGDLARAKTRTLTFRTQYTSQEKSPSLFDAAQAQGFFEKQLVPFIRIVLAHCTSVNVLHVEGVPRNLKQLTPLSSGLTEFGCTVGHYGSSLPPTFFAPDRWVQLTRLQLHGPQFRFNQAAAIALSALARLSQLALVVPNIICSDGTDPLQTLIDSSSGLSSLLLVGHAEPEYVGYSEKYRTLLRSLTQRSNGDEVKVKLATMLRKGISEGARKRVHPCEISGWMFDTVKMNTHWFDKAAQEPAMEWDYWVEDWTPPTFDPLSSATTSAPRTGANTPRQIRPRVPIPAALDVNDLLDDDEQGEAEDVADLD